MNRLKPRLLAAMFAMLFGGACRCGSLLAGVGGRVVALLVASAGFAGLWGVALAGSARAALPAGCSQSGSTVTCTGAGEYPLTVPTGVSSAHVVAVGGSGGTAIPLFGGAAGGRGAVVSGDVLVSAGETLYVEVGGSATTTSACYPQQPCRGGFNGGGASLTEFVAGGGGASDVRTIPRSGAKTLASRLLIAAGGGGAGGDSGDCAGGAGGNAGARGTDGETNKDCNGRPGGGPGTATAGGTAGFPGGDVGTLGAGGSGFTGGGAGGGGLYGGGAGGLDDAGPPPAGGGGGGGGSSLVPAGGSMSIDTTGVPSVAITYLIGAPTPTPTRKGQCKHGGWKNFTDSNGRGLFKNHGDCVAFVATGGKNPPGGKGSKPTAQYTVCESGCPYGELQSAVLAVEHGKITNPITVAPGDYPQAETLFVTGTVVIRGAGDGSDGTILDGSDSSLAVIGVKTPGNLTISGVKITNNNTNVGGGGIANAEGTVTFDGPVSIANNVAENGGGIFNFGGTVTFAADSNATITKNSASARGGGIFNEDGTVTFAAGSNATITNNSASGIFNVDGTVTFAAGSNVSITGNTPDNCFGTTSCP